MFLRCSKRRKDGKEHLYWSVVENRRLPDQRIVQRHVLYLGELNGVQASSWRKTVELFGQDEDAPRQVALFPEEHAPAQVGVERVSRRARAAFTNGPAPSAPMGRVLAGLPVMGATASGRVLAR